MYLRGTLFAESPIYRGNARKTLFTRDADGKDRLVSLAGEIAGTAQSLMDAFIGQSRNGRNVGLLNRLWDRLYGRPMPRDLISSVECHLQERSYPVDRFFDLRMGIRLDEDRWSVEANANYKMETILRNSVFDITFQVNDNLLSRDGNTDKLYYLLQEMIAGRFWFGAGKSKGLGRCRLEMDLPFSASAAPALQNGTNHLTVTCQFDATNPLLVGWNWGKVEPDVPAFAAVEGRVLVESMRTLPAAIRERLQMGIGGPILSPEDWKSKLRAQLPRVTAIWLRSQSMGESETWTLPADALAKLGKGKKHALSKKVLESVRHLTDTAFPSRGDAESAVVEALGNKANMAKRIMGAMVQETKTGHALNQQVWQEVADGLNLDPALGETLASQIEDEVDFTATLSQACMVAMPQLEQQVDRQIHMLQSDSWVDVEIDNREQHVRIKEMVRDGQIDEHQWGDYNQVPNGVTSAVWREFLAGHRRVQYQHMRSPRNLNKSITNDRNFIDFLQAYRIRSRQELAQPQHVEFRAGGRSGREYAKAHGRPFDTIFMRMLTWKPSDQTEEGWEAYIPGSTLKGAFRKRASQVLKTLWGESQRTDEMLDWLFGKQGQAGRIFFADAYLVDPENTDRAWCSLDGITVDPKTAQPIESAKMSFLYAYGEQLQFRTRFDLQDLGDRNSMALAIFQHLLQDFQQGDIPLGGEKTNGMGWVQSSVSAVEWLSDKSDRIMNDFFSNQSSTQEGLWQAIRLQGDAAAEAMMPTRGLVEAQVKRATTPPLARDGFISHRSFGGYCGKLSIEAEVLRSLHIQESGQPSHTTLVDGEPVNGWDFFSMAPAEAESRGENRRYALPSRSLRGMLRHMYAIVSDSRTPSSDLSNLNPVDSLFGWVGPGQNQSLMGRVSVNFAPFESPELQWYRVPNFYNGLRYVNGEWTQAEGQKASKHEIADTWRVFHHAPLAPIIEQLANFTPTKPSDQYLRAVMPGARARFSLRFWNLTKEELERLIWSIQLEEKLAHKLGKNRYLGFGSLRLRLLPASYITDWAGRYTQTNKDTGQEILDGETWHNPEVVYHRRALCQALDAGLG
ncbi:MAG: RAMP superfamily CRISPR-associated protein [Chloroflexota bacterium]